MPAASVIQYTFRSTKDGGFCEIRVYRLPHGKGIAHCRDRTGSYWTPRPRAAAALRIYRRATVVDPSTYTLTREILPRS